MERTDDQAGTAFAWNVLGRAYGGCGQYDQAFAAFYRSRDLAETIDHHFLIAQVPNMLGWLHQQLGDYAGARHYDEEGVALARSWDKLHAEISASLNVQLDILHLGDPAAALAGLHELAQRIADAAFGFHAWRWQLRLAHSKGLCHLALGEVEPALRQAVQGMKVAQSTTSRKYIALNHELKGAVLAATAVATDHWEDAAAELRSAIALADQISYQPLRWQGRHRLATVYAALGDRAQQQSTRVEAQTIVASIAQALGNRQLRMIFLANELVRTIQGETDG
ncbi:MAG: tetratricopeptide repeat protein [Caldilineaceae bacterium]|nr:tetratricopeptide repeat protein [Caldilineaceae bacterium]